MTFHASDCDGSACAGCGWVDGLGVWWPGLCPVGEKPFQQARSEGCCGTQEMAAQTVEWDAARWMLRTPPEPLTHPSVRAE